MPYNKVNQLLLYIYPLLLESPLPAPLQVSCLSYWVDISDIQ